MKDGTFTGTYAINGIGEPKEFPAIGRYDTKEMGAVGWTVSWQNPKMNYHGVTTWSGYFQFDKKGDIFIFTTWTRTMDVGGSTSTDTSTDVFQYKPPSQETIEFAKLRGQQSHPVKS